MFTRIPALFAIAASASILLVSAAPGGGGGNPGSGAPPSTCSTGPVQCCNSVQPSGSENVAKVLGVVGAVVQGVNVPVGITCNPITVIGISGGSCSGQTVCCENNSFNGVVAVGCTPVNVDL